MALDKVLKVYDDNGNEIDYDILAKDVKFLPDGKDLPTKLAELEDEIGQGGYDPPEGGIPKTDLAQSVQDSLDKADSALQEEDLADYAAKTELQQGLGGKQDAIVAGNGIVIGNDGKTVSVAEAIRTGAGKGATAVQSVSVESEEDGTVDIHVDNDKYTINLNHEHQGMAKLAKFVASNPPASMANDTIYAQVDNLTTPTEIQSLWLFGCEFIGGIPDTGLPQVTKPISGSVIDLGENSGSGASKVVLIKARNLTNNLTVAVGTGLTVTYNGTTASSVTIPKADAILGVDVTVAYTGTAELDDGAMAISHGNDMLASYTVVADKAWEEIDLSDTSLQVHYWPGADFMAYDDSSSIFKVSCLIDASGLSQLKITANNDKSNAYFVFLKTALPASTNADLQYATYVCTGETGRRSQPKGTTETYALPNDCAYILVGMISNGSLGGTQYTPEYVGVK